MKKLLFVSLMAVSSFVLAKSDSYSATYHRCMEKSGGVTVEMLDCTDAEYKKQDARLNANYKKTMNMLRGNAKQDLLNSQRLWIKQKDKKCNASTDELGGSMASVVASDCFLAETLKRADYLEKMVNSAK